MSLFKLKTSPKCRIKWLIDADMWKYFLCSRAYGKHSYHLSEAVSGLAKRLCSEKIHPDTDSLRGHISCRLILLDKGADKDGNPGIRPIGIGDALYRMMGKICNEHSEIRHSKTGGCLQTYTGIRSDIKAAIHVTNNDRNLESTDCLLEVPVDADNDLIG